MSVFSFAGNNDKGKIQARNITGKISSEMGEDVAAAKITIKETNEVYFADLSGNFKFQIKNDKPYSIIIEQVGYSARQLKSTDLHLFSEIRLKEL